MVVRWILVVVVAVLIVALIVFARGQRPSVHFGVTVSSSAERSGG